MRPHVRALVAEFARAVEFREPIHEFGSYLVAGQDEIADVRPLFPGKRFVGCDVRKGPGVDRVEDLRRLTLPDRSVGSALLLETLEHTADPVQALREVARVLEPRGAVLVTSCLDFKIHAYPEDFFRFTPSGIGVLLEPFAHRWIGFQGHPKFPHTVFGFASHRPVEFPSDFVSRLETACRVPIGAARRAAYWLGEQLLDRASFRTAREWNRLEFGPAG